MTKSITTLIVKAIGFYINCLSFILPQKAGKLAYKFFSEPRKGKLNLQNLPEVLKTAELEILNTETAEFPVYIWKGNETKILLVHGWESNAARWETFLPHILKTGSTVLALDAPAHGLASGKEFNVPSYALCLDRVFKTYQPGFMIGHSIGGAACLYYQHYFQNTALNKMVILGAPSDLSVLIENYAQLLSLNRKVVNLLELHFYRKFQKKTSDFRGSKLASNLTIEGIISHDTEDDVVAFDESLKIKNAWKKAHFIETQGLGHSMHDVQLYNRIVEFLFQNQ